MSSAFGKGGCKVYFGGLTEATGIITEELFRELLEKEDVTPQCQEDTDTNTNVWIKSGYAFAMFDGEEAAKDAISKFNGYVLNGITLVAEISKDSDKTKSLNTCVKLSNISNSVTQRTLEPIISRFGKVDAIEFTPGAGQEKDNRSVTVTYQLKEEADEAVKNLNNYELSGSTLQAQITEKTERKLSYPNERPNVSISTVNSTKKMMNEKGSPTNGQKGGLAGRVIDFPLRVLVQSEMVGAIIGRSGQTIKQITQQSRARVDVHRKENVGSIEKAITIYGQPENCTTACHQIMKVMQEEAKNTGKPEDMPLKLLAHNNLVGRIIGKQGATIKRIMDETDTKIAVSSISEINTFNPERIITVKGEIDNMSKAEGEISSKLRAAYEADVQAMAPQSIMFPGLHPTTMMSTVGMGGMLAGGVGGLHHGGNTANHMGGGGPMGNQSHHIGGHRPGHVGHPAHLHGPGQQGGHNQGFGGSHGFAGFNGGGPPHQNSHGGQNNHGIGLVGHHPHGHQVNPSISKAHLALAGHGHSGFNVKDQHLNNSQAAALAAAASAMSGLHIGAGAANGGGIGSGPHGSALQAETSYLHIPNTSVGAVIGTKGSHIRNIIKFSGANVKIAPNSEDEKETTVGQTAGADGLPSPTDRRVTIIGAPESQWKAQYLICEKLREEGFASGLADIRLIVEIMVPSSQVGRIIGKGGANVRELQRVTGALIKLPEQGTSTGDEISVHIVGTFYSVQSAQRRLRAMVEVALNGGSINIGGGGPLHHPMNGAPANPHHRDTHMIAHGHVVM